MCRLEGDGAEGVGEGRTVRPKRKWFDNIRNDLSEIELSGPEAQDRVKRRRLIRNVDPKK